jgi:hypothetical protein
LAIVWREKRDIHNPPAESIFYDEKGNAVKIYCGQGRQYGELLSEPPHENNEETIKKVTQFRPV